MFAHLHPGRSGRERIAVFLAGLRLRTGFKLVELTARVLYSGYPGDQCLVGSHGRIGIDPGGHRGEKISSRMMSVIRRNPRWINSGFSAFDW